YLGFLISSIVTPKLVTDVGHIRVFAAFASIASAAVLVHSMVPEPIVWFGLRFFTGVAIAGLYVVCESWLNQTASNEERGKVFSLYMIVVAGCMGIGQFILPLADPSGHTLFIVVSIFVSVALVPISLSRSPAPTVVTLERLGLLELYRLSPLGVVSCFLIGIAQGGLFSLGPVYATELDFNTTEIAVFMALPFFVLILIQFPIGALSDRMDRRPVIAGVAIVAAASSALVGVFAGQNVTLVYAFFAVFGACAMSLYGLTIAHANDAMPTEKILPASAMLVLVYAVGSFGGPTITGLAMSQLGNDWFLWLGTAIHLAIAAYALYRMTQRAATPGDERGEYVPVLGRTTGIAQVAAIEAVGEEGGWITYEEDETSEEDEAVPTQAEEK
ncbi:MAG: MFS transporter, partial [Pseudomonadota bacterium]